MNLTTNYCLRPVMLHTRLSLDNQHPELLSLPLVIALVAITDLPKELLSNLICCGHKLLAIGNLNASTLHHILHTDVLRQISR
jgi:hypothetical protein